MKYLSVYLRYNSQPHTYIILDDFTADASYAKLKAAMQSYEKFSNNDDQIVEIITGPGDSVCFAVCDLICVGVTPSSDLIATRVADRRVADTIEALSKEPEPSAKVPQPGGAQP